MRIEIKFCQNKSINAIGFSFDRKLKSTPKISNELRIPTVFGLDRKWKYHSCDTWKMTIEFGSARK